MSAGTLRAVGIAAALSLGLAACGAGQAGTNAGSASTQTTATTPLPGQGRPPVTVGDTNTYEQFVLGALYEQALAAEGYSVSINRNIGPVEVRVKALQTDSVTIYPEYLDTWDTSIAGYKSQFGSARHAYRAGQHYALGHGMQLLNPTPFSDTNALGVTLAYAVDNDLNTIKDLRKVQATLAIGGPPQFQNTAPGLTQIENAYGFVPASFKALPFGGQYTALDHDMVQAADVNTTDGELGSGDYVLLNDPQHVFGWGNVVPVVSQKALQQEGAAFVATINEVSALLSERVMRQLNADVAILGEDPAKVAEQFLEAHNLVPESSSG